MLNHFQKIKNVGCYDEYQFNAKLVKPFNDVNILYGNNGSGKTTFSNLLFLASKHCKNKANLHAELIDDDSELEIATATGKITHKNILDKNLDLYVFNSKFVSDHVYNGTVANIDSFSSEIKLTSPEIERIDTFLERAKSRSTILERWVTLIETKLDSIFKVYNDEFQKKVSGARLTGVKPPTERKGIGSLKALKDELIVLYRDYTEKSNESATIEKYNALKVKLDMIVNIGVDLEQVKHALSSKVSTKAKGKIAKRIFALENHIELKGQQAYVGDLNDWYRKGGRMLHFSKSIDNHCPLCDTDLSSNIDHIIEEYSGYFSATIVSLFELIDAAILSLSSFITNKQSTKNDVIIKDLIFLADSAYSMSIKPLEYPHDLQAELLPAVETLLKIIKEKKQDPEMELSLSEAQLNVIFLYIECVNSFKMNVLDQIEERLQVIQAVGLDSIIKNIKSKIGMIVSVELNALSNNIFPSKNKTNSDIVSRVGVRNSEIKQSIAESEALRSAEVAKLNAESKYINIYLKSFGIDHFTIDKDKEKSHDNLIITYANSGKQKTQLNHSLSEGEKTALAFAYFISKLRVEKIETGTNGFNGCVIVIDDPISSLDDNRLFQTANLIDSFLFYNIQSGEEPPVLCYPAQVFILSHNLTFVKYFHNAIRGNNNLKDRVNEYYLSRNAPIIKKLPSGLKNFTNTYILKLREIMDFKDKKIEYDVAKNYLPNYIRIVLETFLSFKLAVVNDYNDRLPGLSFLITGMVNEFNLIADVEIDGVNKDGVIKRLNHLKKIADHESHGSIYRAEEFAFISEDELKMYAKYTLQIVNFIDSLHFRKIKGHGG